MGGGVGGVYVILKNIQNEIKSIDKYTKILNKSQIISFKRKLFSVGSRGQGRGLMCLKRDNWVCIINNQLEFDIKIHILLFYGMNHS